MSSGSGTLAIELGKAAGMKFAEDVSFLEVLRSRFSIVHRIAYHFTLPEDKIEALAFVMKEICKQAMIYYEKYNQRPTMIIDAIDWLAKNDEKLFKALLFEVKKAVNDSNLNIILVSSESHLLPKLDEQPEKMRSFVFHIGDIKCSDAEEFFKHGGIPKNLIPRIREVTGTRMMLIYQAIDHYKYIHHKIDQLDVDEVKKEEMMFNEIKKYLWKWPENDALKAEVLPRGQGFEYKKFIVELLLDSEPDYQLPQIEIIEKLLNKFEDLHLKDASAIINHLLKCNILSRVDSSLTFQSQLHKEYLKTKFKA